MIYSLRSVDNHESFKIFTNSTSPKMLWDEISADYYATQLMRAINSRLYLYKGSTKRNDVLVSNLQHSFPSNASLKLWTSQKPNLIRF